MLAGASAELWERWIELWNGNLDLGNQIIHPDFEVHRVPMPHVPDGLGGREALVEWVKQTRSILEGLRFTVEVGPFSTVSWSPDSTEVVFEIHPPDCSEDVAIVNADGTGYRQLTFGNGKTLNFAPSFSPDGTKIIFSRFRSTGGIDLFTMNPDGSGVTQVTETAAPDLWSQWAIAT